VTGHLTRRELEQLVAEDPQFPVAPALRVHVSGCDRCNVRRLALHGSRARYLAAHPATDFAQAVAARAAASTSVAPIRRKPPVFALSAGALALTAAALVWFRPVAPPAAIRLKGGASLEVIASHAGRQRSLRDGDALSPGDQLAFAYVLDRPRHLLLVDVDDAGVMTRYFPNDDVRESSLPASPRAQLPVGIELDAQPGDERVYALFSDAPLDETVVENAVRRGLAAKRADGDGIAELQELDLPVSVDQQTIWFHKPGANLRSGR
jgi:hypothetical protein